MVGDHVNHISNFNFILSPPAKSIVLMLAMMPIPNSPDKAERVPGCSVVPMQINCGASSWHHLNLFLKKKTSNANTLNCYGTS